MEVKKYRGKYTAPASVLYEKGIIITYPVQVERTDLEYDEGIDIVYRFRNMTPAKLREYADVLLLAAYTEGERYREYKYKFAKLEVELNRTAKGRKTVNPRRTYIAAKHPDVDVMVYGEEALGYELPEGVKKPFLVDKVEEVLGIPESESPGPYVKKQRPYKVISMTICIRAGLRLRERALELAREKLEEGK